MKKIILLFIFLVSFSLFSQQKKASEKLMLEIQQIHQNDKTMKMVWWIPTEFWQVVIEENNLGSQEQIDYIKNLLDDYMILLGGDYSFNSANDGAEFKVNNVKNTFVFYGIDGKKQTPLKDSEINQEGLRLIKNSLKRIFVQMLGKTGDGIEFFIYNNKKNKERIINPMSRGNFKVDIANESFVWKLPLVSLMEEKICPVDQQKMEGNWIFCPFHGEKLQ